MAHSPLRLFRKFHDKHVLVSGQGPVADIAKNCGFTDVTTIDEFRAAFPLLDAVDHHRRASAVRFPTLQHTHGLIIYCPQSILNP